MVAGKLGGMGKSSEGVIKLNGATARQRGYHKSRASRINGLGPEKNSRGHLATHLNRFSLSRSRACGNKGSGQGYRAADQYLGLTQTQVWLKKKDGGLERLHTGKIERVSATSQKKETE